MYHNRGFQNVHKNGYYGKCCEFQKFLYQSTTLTPFFHNFFFKDACTTLLKGRVKGTLWFYNKRDESGGPHAR